MCVCLLLFATQQPETQPGNTDAALALRRLGMALWAVGKYERAVEVFRRATLANEAAFGNGSNEVSECLHGLGMTLVEQVN